MKQKPPRTRVKIPKSIYLTNQATQTDQLTRLPAELGRQIRDHLPADADKTCLALSCKANAEFFECVQKKTRQQPHTLVKKVNFMLRLRGFKGTRKTRLCFNCAKFMPISGSMLLAYGAWGGKMDVGKRKAGNAVESDTIKGPRCPKCVSHDRDYAEAMAHWQSIVESGKRNLTQGMKQRAARAEALIRRGRNRCR